MYIEGITDTYSQYYVNDIEHSESNKHVKSANSHCSYHLNKLL